MIDNGAYQNIAYLVKSATMIHCCRFPFFLEEVGPHLSPPESIVYFLADQAQTNPGKNGKMKRKTIKRTTNTNTNMNILSFFVSIIHNITHHLFHHIDWLTELYRNFISDYAAFIRGLGCIHLFAEANDPYKAHYFLKVIFGGMLIIRLVISQEVRFVSLDAFSIYDLRNPVGMQRNEIHRANQNMAKSFRDDCQKIIQRLQLKSKLYDFHVALTRQFLEHTNAQSIGRSSTNPTPSESNNNDSPHVKLSKTPLSVLTPSNSLRSSPATTSQLNFPIPSIDFVNLLKSFQTIPRAPVGSKHLLHSAIVEVSLGVLSGVSPVDIFSYFARNADRYNFRNLEKHGITPALFVSTSFLSQLDRIKFGIQDIKRSSFAIVVLLQQPPGYYAGPSISQSPSSSTHYTPVVSAPISRSQSRTPDTMARESKQEQLQMQQPQQQQISPTPNQNQQQQSTQISPTPQINLTSPQPQPQPHSNITSPHPNRLSDSQPTIVQMAPITQQVLELQKQQQQQQNLQYNSLTLEFFVVGVANSQQEGEKMIEMTNFVDSVELLSIAEKTKIFLGLTFGEALKHYQRDELWSKLLAGNNVPFDANNLQMLQELVVRTPIQKLDPSLESLLSLQQVRKERKKGVFILFFVNLCLYFLFFQKGFLVEYA